MNQPSFPPNVPFQQTIYAPPQPPPNSTFNWELVAKNDPETIQITSDVDTMKAILNEVAKCTFTHDQQINPRLNPNVYKLIRLIQVVFNYMLKCQDDIVKSSDEYYSIVKNLERKLNATQNKLKKASTKLRSFKKIAKCPVCSRNFISLQHLDGHISKMHHSISKAWISIRQNKVSEETIKIENVQAQIEEMRREMLNRTVPQQSIRQTQMTQIIQPQQEYEEIPQSIFNKPKKSKKPVKLESESDDEFGTTIRDPIPTHPVKLNQPEAEFEAVEIQKTPFEIESEEEIGNKKSIPPKLAKDATEFLSRQGSFPVTNEALDEIVHKLKEKVHEQSRQVMSEHNQDNNPDSVRKDIKNDIKRTRPMPKMKKGIKKTINEIGNNSPDKPKKEEKQHKEKPKKAELEEKKEKSDKEISDKSSKSVSDKSRKATPTKKYSDSMPMTSSNEPMFVKDETDEAQYSSAKESSHAKPEKKPKAVKAPAQPDESDQDYNEESYNNDEYEESSNEDNNEEYENEYTYSSDVKAQQQPQKQQAKKSQKSDSSKFAGFKSESEYYEEESEDEPQAAPAPKKSKNKPAKKKESNSFEEDSSGDEQFEGFESDSNDEDNESENNADKTKKKTGTYGASNIKKSTIWRDTFDKQMANKNMGEVVGSESDIKNEPPIENKKKPKVSSSSSESPNQYSDDLFESPSESK